MLAYFAKLTPVLIGMEACGGAHYWARELTKLGHGVKLMAPQFPLILIEHTKLNLGTMMPLRVEEVPIIRSSGTGEGALR